MPPKRASRAKRARAPSPTPDLDTSHRDSLISSAGPGTPLEGEVPAQSGSESVLPETQHGGKLHQSVKGIMDMAEHYLKTTHSTSTAEVEQRTLAYAARMERMSGASVVAEEKTKGKGKGKGKASPNKKQKVDAKVLDEGEDVDDFLDLSLLTNVQLKHYQIYGVYWLANRWENGLSGILADEMGLGKTLQTIALLAHLRAKGVYRLNIIVVPLSVLGNWQNEFKRFAPTIPVLRYYGSIAEREIMRRDQLGIAAKGQGGARYIEAEDLPIILTTYETAMNDVKFFENTKFSFMVVDESHRLKNKDCKLVKQLKQYQTENRLLLTGTPLQNTLLELWSLLSFILPDVFKDPDIFVKGFDLSAVTQSEEASRVASDAAAAIAAQLHRILQPFMLRRLKIDVEQNLPMKKEYIISAPLTSQQKELYVAVLNGTLPALLFEKNMGDTVIPVKELEKTQRGSKDKRRKRYVGMDVDEGIDEENDDFEQELEEPKDHRSLEQIGVDHKIKTAHSLVNKLNLQNPEMQLRKVVNHPYLFYWPKDSYGNELLDEELMNASGKLLLLSQILDRLLAEGHKVLIFSNFARMLDIVHDWLNIVKQMEVYRIDGSTKEFERGPQVSDFNDPDSDVKVFLLTTRAGGMGINLTGADTVIFLDSDWNPQIDLQAIARAHRIGQTKPVLIFRLATSHTIEARILERAGSKRKLEQLVIGGAAFKGDSDDINEALSGHRAKAMTMDDLALQIKAMEGETITLAKAGDLLLSHEQLTVLLDRSDKTMRSKAAWGGESKISFEVAAEEEEVEEL